MSYESLAVHVEDHVATVTLIGPGKGNAMGPAFWREIPQVFAELDRDEAVRAVLVRGRGDHFSYGLDLMAMAAELGPHIMGENLAAGRTRFLDLILELQKTFAAIAACRKPVIAAVHGWCVGGGLDMISACDIRHCAAGARFSLREVKLAIVADMGSLQRLPAIIGQGHTRELAFTGGNIDAARAAQIGLVNRVWPDAETLFAEAGGLAREIASNPPLVVQGIKRVMNYGADKSVTGALGYVAVWNAAFLQSSDFSEALAAFSEKRDAVFKGE